MTGRGRNRGNRGRGNNEHASVAKETVCSLALDSPVLTMFRKTAVQLNERQDRHERLVKLSRDITIESKRVIFLLHSALTQESTAKAVHDAKERLQKLINGPLKMIGIELENSPAYLHSRAITAGFQEFIEAFTLCSVIDTKNIIQYSEVQKKMMYVIKDAENQERIVITQLPHCDYMLGVSDLTGELMRRAINSISSGDTEDCFHSCQVVRDLYTGYLGLYGIGKELARKMTTTRSNLSKVEQAVYTLKVRGREAPPTLLLAAPPTHDWEAGGNQSDDEGFY